LSTSHGAWLRAPYDVVHAGAGDAWLGQLNAAADASGQLQSLLDLLPARQFNVRKDNNIELRLWRKLAINCAVNALTVIHDCRNGDLLTIPDARQALATLCDEISTLLQGIPGAPASDDLHAQVHAVLTVTADNLSSTLQDIRRGRPTEISHLNGYLCELADRHRLACPANKAVLQQMRVIESAACGSTGSQTDPGPAQDTH
ncbi:MAG: 2-dehydropantoate 2-reductase, partial [Pseudohongiella sp.]